MSLDRRNFLRASLSVFGAALSAFPLPGQQRRGGGLHPPEPAEQMQMIVRPGGDVPRQVAAQGGRGQQFRRYLDQVSDCANRLRAEIADRDDTNVISVAVYKETQLLERLAKQLRTLAKG